MKGRNEKIVQALRGSKNVDKSSCVFEGTTKAYRDKTFTARKKNGIFRFYPNNL